MVRAFHRGILIAMIGLFSMTLAVPNRALPAESGPLRMVCTSYDVMEMLKLLGCSEQVIGKPAGYHGPGFAHAEEIGSFIDVDVQRIVKLSPALVITYSDIQAHLAGKLTKNHLTVLALNHHNLRGIYDSLLLLGRILGKEKRALEIVGGMQSKIEWFRNSAPPEPHRPTVYFEEYDDPYITAAEWVSEMIEIAGGINVNKGLSVFKSANQRVVSTEFMIKRNPDIIISTWCGKEFDKNEIRSRRGWERIRAVRNDRIYTVPHELVLQPSPRIIEGIAIMRELFEGYEGWKPRD
jgi:iron complex transport system substrate-binding protein